MAPASAARDQLVVACCLLENALAACWLFGLGACVRPFICGAIPPAQRHQVGEYGLAIALITFWQQSQIATGEVADETRGRSSA
jgi:hypothetical protein